jgi:glycosyltransferase involved in cell wall biosynthesis
VAIHDNFVRHYEGWGLRTDHVEVIENWAPLDDVAPGERDNAWAQEQGLPSDSLRLLYAGTLGRKHNPLLLLEILDATRAKGIDATLVVCSEGVGADELRVAAGDRPDVRILGYQPAERFAEVLASADVMIALLEPHAAAFSVPSKVLSYMSAGRPTIALVPDGNPAARDVRAAGGFVAQPSSAGVEQAAGWLAQTLQADPAALARLGRQARQLAEQKFDIGAIADRFEDVLQAAIRRGGGEQAAEWQHNEEAAA